jgi:hypothetical protein
VENTNDMKLRLLLMGFIISAIGAILLATRGFATDFVGFLAVGIGLLVLGTLWKSQKPWRPKHAGIMGHPQVSWRSIR